MPRSDQVHRVDLVHQMSQGALGRFHQILEQVPETVESAPETVEQGHRALPADPGLEPPSSECNR